MKNVTFIRAISVVIALIVGYTIGILSIYYFQAYGWTVFTLTPFLLGLIPTLIVGRYRGIDKSHSYILGMVTLVIFCFSTLLFALEGVICILMASPIMVLSALIGSRFGFHLIQPTMMKRGYLYTLVSLPIAFFIIDLSASFEELLEVKTSILIEASVDEVWDHVISFGQIDEPTDWLFKTGISYPTDAHIDGEGLGATRYCNFTTGSFVEPITTWQAPFLLQFDVVEQPVPMKEVNPFWEVHPPHLNGYFLSSKGQFELKELENGMTLLEGTTWYQVQIIPVFYWNIWSKYILH